ncbi:MAG: hypothetical protein LKE51_06850 [Selenomonas sp.]|nr:hypothetical protein [Selenomonas sp.]
MDDILATAEILLYAIRNDIIPNTEARRAYLAQWQEKFDPAGLIYWTISGERQQRCGHGSCWGRSS